MPDTDPYDAIVAAASGPRGRKSATDYDSLIEKHATKEGVDPNLMRAVMGQESGGQRTVVSPKGARGLMQLMPGTAARFGTTDVNDPDQNIRGGARYLRFLNDRFKGNTDLVLAGYNAGEGAVEKYGNRIPPYKETQNYVPAVKARYRRLTGQDPQPIAQPAADPYDAIVAAANPQTPKGRTPKVQSPWQVRSGVTAGKPGVTGARVSGEVTPAPTMGETLRTAGRVAMRSTDLGRVLPTSVQDATSEQLAKGGAGLLRTASGAIKNVPRAPRLGMRAPEPVERASRAIRAPINQLAGQLEQGAGEMTQGRNVVSQAAQDVGGGLISSAPALVLQRLGVPAPVAFGIDSYLKSSGRDADWKDVLKETGLGAATGALFETPLPNALKQRILAQIGAKLAVVGGGTFALEKLAGVNTKKAATDSAVMALMAGAGARRGAKPEVVPEGAEPAFFRAGKRVVQKDGQFTITERTEQTQGVAEPADVRQEIKGNVRAGNQPAVEQVAEGLPSETPKTRAQRQAEAQRRLDDGTFGKETNAEKEARRAQVSQPAAEPETTPPSASETPVAPAENLPSRAAQPAGAETTALMPGTTSARKAQFAEDRAALDLPELPPAERKSWQTSLNNAQPERASLLADEVLKRPRALNDEETASLVVRAQQIKNEHARVMEEIGKATEADLETKRAQADVLEQEFDKLTEATKKSGTEKGRTLAAQKLTINQDYDLVSLLNRAKKAKGRDLTPDERTRYEQLSKKLADLEQKQAEQAAKQGVSRIEREVRREKRQVSRKALDDEAAMIKQNIAAEFQRIRTQQGIQPSGLAGIDPEGVITKLALKYAKNRFNAGLTDVAQLVDDVHSVLSEFTSVTKRQVAEMISGYQLPQKPETKESLQKTLADLREEMRSALRQADIEAGKVSPRPEGPKLSEGTGRREGPPRLPREGPTLREGTGAREGPQLGPRQGPKLREGMRRTEGPRLSEGTARKEGPRITEAPKVGPRETKKQIESRYQEQINDLERRIRERDFTPKTKRGPTVLDRETQRLQEQAQKLKSQFDAELERSSPWYFLKNISGIRKSGMLSGYLTHLRNIGGTAAYQGFEEVRRVPSVMADAALSAATGRRTATLSPSAMLDGVTQALTVGRKEAGEILRLGASKEQLSKQQLQEINTGVKAIDLAFNSVFRFMSASDRIFYQGSYKRNLMERAQAQAITERRTDPTVDVRVRARELAENPSQQLEADAKHDALVSTFNNNNRLSDAIKRGRSSLGAGGNFALDMVMPFDRTPTNVIARVIEASPAGYLKNAGQLARSLWKGSMSAAEQRSFQETFGRATTGTAVMALGFALAAKGILTTDEYGTTKLKIGRREINLSAVAPLGTLLGVGAAIQQASRKPSVRGYAGAFLKPLADQPLLRASSQVSDFIKDPARSGTKFVANTAFSFVPFSGAIRAVAQDTDVKRYPRGLIENVEQNIPGLRQTLPSENPSATPAGRSRREGRPSRR